MSLHRSISKLLASRRLVALLAVLLPLLLGASPLFAGEREAVEAYRRGDYTQAADEWRSLLADPALPAQCEERWRILYNLGNCSYRRDRKLEAVGWYTLALEQRPRDAQTWANLELARSESGLDPQDRGDLSSTLLRLLDSWTQAESGWIAMAGLGLLALALAFEALRGGKPARVLVWIGLAVFVLALLPLCLHAWRDPRPWRMCTERSPVTLRSEPREDAAGIGDLAPGARVADLDQLPDWIKVETSDGTQGWVPRSACFP